MRTIGWHRLPSLALGVIGLYVAGTGIELYLRYLRIDPSHELGLLAEFLLVGHLLVGLLVIGIGAVSYRDHRIALPMAGVVFALMIEVGYRLDVWTRWNDTQFAGAVLLTMATIPALVVWSMCKLPWAQQLRPRDDR